MRQLILASSSPARKEILTRNGVAFTVDASSYEEDMTLNMEPKELAMHLSRGKAQDVAKQHADVVVLGADSFAVFGNQLLGKPHTMDKAREMLTMLSGQMHSFVTGFTIIDTQNGKEFSAAVETKVYFRDLSESDIAGYLAKEKDVLNRAGAYIIQDLGAVLVERIDGSYTNVMGLPVSHVGAALKQFGINFL